MPSPTPVLTKYVERIKNKALAGPISPFGPGYDVLFDEKIPVTGGKEIRVWVHVFVDNYETTPVTASTKLDLRFMHDFCGANSFDYAVSTISYNHVSSYINGVAFQPIIGKELRLVCHPRHLPAGPYRLSLTYLLVR
jgi:hypothetical protein